MAMAVGSTTNRSACGRLWLTTEHEEEGNGRGREGDLAAGVIEQCVRDIEKYERLLVRSRFGEKKDVAGHRHALLTTRPANNGDRGKGLYMNAESAIKFLCWENKMLGHWCECLGISQEGIIRWAKKEFAWMHKAVKPDMD